MGYALSVLRLKNKDIRCNTMQEEKKTQLGSSRTPPK